MKTKLIRITTVPISLQKLIAGQMRFMGDNGFEVCMISSDFDGKAALETKENAPFIPLNMQRTIAPLADLKSLFQLIKTFKELKPTIVHTHTPKAGMLGMLASWFVKTPIRLHTVAGLPLMETTGFKRKLLSFVEKLTYSCATKVYPNSKNLEEFIISNKFCKAQKLKVIGNGGSNGINTDFFKLDASLTEAANTIKAQHNLTEDNFNFVFVGRLVKDKGIEELVQAFSSLTAQYPLIRLLLVGPLEPERDPLSAECLQAIENNSAIIAFGYQDDVRPYLAAGNALVFPSYREGFPNVPMQAGCFELPGIVTNINGCNEIIEEEKNGLIIPVKDAAALKAAMERLLTDKLLLLQLKANARKMIVDRYEQRYFWSLLLNEYQMHLKDHGIVS